MFNIDYRIIKFIEKHHVLTLATSFKNQPYCANCFYAYIKNKNLFVFTSDPRTRHAREAISQPQVAGTIVLETWTVGKIQGIQFTGKMYVPEIEIYEICNNAYFKRFPVANLMETHLWVIEPDFIKMTHNILGFGKKMIWKMENNITEIV